jgi:site-specific recombinase XerD
VARGWLKAGANLAQVSQMLGHTDESVTVRLYGAFVDEELKAAHRKYTVVREDEFDPETRAT